MILTGKKIKAEVLKGSITIEPFLDALVNPNSYNYRLGPVIFEVADEVIDPKKASKLIKHTLTAKGFVLQPKTLYLGTTLEKIGSDQFVTSLIGRSSIGRLGLFLQITADLGNLGNAHAWTLEMKVVQPLRVYPGMRIGQVSFWQPAGLIKDTYLTGYTDFSVPTKSKFYQEMPV